MGGKTYTRHNIEIILVTILILLAGSILIIPLDAEASDEPEVMLSLWTGDDDSLSPCDVDLYELKVTNATREGFLGYGFIPYDSDLWREVGTWGTEPLLRDMEIIDDASCYVLLKDINSTEADIRIRFYIDGNQIGDTILLEDKQVGPDPELHWGSTSTSGTTISEGSQFQVRIDVRVISESCYFIGGFEGTRVDFSAKPITLSAIEYEDGELTVTVKESFGVDMADITVEVRLSGGNIMDFTQSRDGVNLFLNFNRYLSDGSYGLFLTIEYSGGITVGPSKYFSIDTSGQVTDDDDDDDDYVYDDDDDDDDDYWYDDDDDDYDFELLTYAQCERFYSDDYGDDVAYAFKIDDNKQEISADIGKRSQIDVTTVQARRDGEDLVISVELKEEPGIFVIVSVYFVESGFQQPKVNLDPNIYESPFFEPTGATATNMEYRAIPIWPSRQSESGKVVEVRGSLGELMELGVTESFEVFVITQDMDLEVFDIEEEQLEGTLYYDYAGYGAYTITEEDKKQVNKGADDSTDPWEEYLPYVIASVLLVIAIIIVIVVVVVKAKKNPQR